MNARDLQNAELGSSSAGVTTGSMPRIGNGSLGANGNKKSECPLQQAHQGGVGKRIHNMDSLRHISQTDTCQASTHLGKRERDGQACSVLKPVDPKLSKLNALATAGSTSQDARSYARLSSQVLGASGTNDETQYPVEQAKGRLFYREVVHPQSQDRDETSHRWIFGAIAELLDNAVDEVPYGSTKLLIDSVVNPRDGSPSLLVQDDGQGMNPISLWKCMTAACPNKKPRDSIGQNGTGFKAATSCLGTGAIVFSRHVHTSMPTQSIGLRFHLSGEETDQNHMVIIPMVHYKYDPVTAETIGHERKPGQFCINMAMLLRYSPYNSEEELLQNFNDIGPHGTKIIVFSLARNTRGDLDLDFNTDTKDIRISAATMHTENKAVGDQSHLVYQYRTSLRAYVSILYMGLPKHFRIILRGEEVKRRNLVTELKHSQYIRYRRSATEREDEVVLGFLDDAPNVGADRFCFYYKKRLVLPFVPAYEFSDRNRSIVGVLQPNHLKLAKNKQDFQWSTELEALLKILKEMETEFWKRMKGKELKEAASQLSLAPPGSHDEANLTGSNTTGMHCQMAPPAPAHLAAPIFESSYGGIPSCMVPRAPAPCLQLFPTTPSRYGQKRLMDMAGAQDQGSNSNGVPARRPTTLPLRWNNGGTSSQDILRAPAPQLPTSAVASMAGDRHRRQPTMPTVASANNYAMNINGTSASTAFWSAYLALAWPFSQTNSSSVGPNGAMRAPAPHLAALYMSATHGHRRRSTPASSVTGAAAPFPATQAITANTIGTLASSHSVPAGAMVAVHDLPLEMEHHGTNDETAIPLAIALPDPAEGDRAIFATATPAPIMNGNGDGRASAFYPWYPPGFEPVHGSSSSSRQARELQGGSNQREQGAKPLPNLFKP